jgi:hypothetical protein
MAPKTKEQPAAPPQAADAEPGQGADEVDLAATVSELREQLEARDATIAERDETIDQLKSDAQKRDDEIEELEREAETREARIAELDVATVTSKRDAPGAPAGARKTVTYLGQPDRPLQTDEEGAELEEDVYVGTDHADGPPIRLQVGESASVSEQKAAQLAVDYPDAFQID